MLFVGKTRNYSKVELVQQSASSLPPRAPVDDPLLYSQVEVNAIMNCTINFCR